MKLIITCSVLLFVLCGVGGDEHSHIYEQNEEVVLWMNTVGPFYNRQERYAYYSLPFCKGTKEVIGHYHETLGEALQGVELDFSGLDIEFKASSSETTYCEIHLDEEKLKAFIYAVKNHYWYQMYIDDLPIWGVVGDMEEGLNNQVSYFIWTHKKFDIGYNGKHIVDVNLTSEVKVKLENGARIKFTYEVNWVPSSVKFEDRFDKYLDPNFFQHRLHMEEEEFSALFFKPISDMKTKMYPISLWPSHSKHKDMKNLKL